MPATNSPKTTSPKTTSSDKTALNPNAVALAGGSIAPPLAPHEPSLCIARVFPNIKERRIRAIFRELGLGEIDHIDFVERHGRDGKPFNRVFIHMKQWADGFDDLRRRLINNPPGNNSKNDESVFKIIYDDPWFWILSANTAQKHFPIQRPKPKIIM